MFLANSLSSLTPTIIKDYTVTSVLKLSDVTTTDSYASMVMSKDLQDLTALESELALELLNQHNTTQTTNLDEILHVLKENIVPLVEQTSFEDYVTLTDLVHLLVHLVDLSIRLVEVTLQITELALETVDPILVHAGHAWRVVDTIFTEHNPTFKMSGKILKTALVLKVASSGLNAISRSLKKMKTMFGEDNPNAAAIIVMAETVLDLAEPLFRMADMILRMADKEQKLKGSVLNITTLITLAISMLKTAAITLRTVQAIFLATDPAIEMMDPVFMKMIATSIKAIEQFMRLIEPLVQLTAPVTRRASITVNHVLSNPVVQSAMSPLVKMANPFVKMADPVVSVAAQGIRVAGALQSGSQYVSKMFGVLV